MDYLDSLDDYSPDANPLSNVKPTAWAQTLDKLKEHATEAARALAENVELELFNGKPGTLENAAGTLMFLTTLNLKVAIQNIKEGLKNRHLIAAVDKDGKTRLLMHMKSVIEKEFCIGGGTVQLGLHPEDYDRIIESDGMYFIELFPRVENKEDLLVIDMDAKQTRLKSGEVETPLGQMLPILDTGRFVRGCTISEDFHDNLTTFRVNIRRPNSTKQNHYSIHQLVYNVGASNGFGLSKYPPLLAYLGLTEQCQGWEDCEDTWFRYHQVNDPKTEEAIKKREEYLKSKGWEEVKTARWSDMDHLVGRSQVWMNSNIFIICCSHQWNQQAARVRIFFEEWLYMMGYIKYGTGND